MGGMYDVQFDLIAITAVFDSVIFDGIIFKALVVTVK